MIYLLNLIISGSNPGILDLDASQKDLGFSSVAASGGTEKNSISKPDSVHRKGMPFYPQLRWRWAIRRVIGNIRRSKLQIALTRFRLLKGSSMEERLARVESAVFKEAFKTHDKVNELAMTAARKAEEVERDRWRASAVSDWAGGDEEVAGGGLSGGESGEPDFRFSETVQRTRSLGWCVWLCAATLL